MKVQPRNHFFYDNSATECTKQKTTETPDLGVAVVISQAQATLETEAQQLMYYPEIYIFIVVEIERNQGF